MRLALLIFRYFPFGGLQRDFRAIAELLQARGHHVEVFTRDWQGPKPHGFAVHLVPTKAQTNHGRDTAFVQEAMERARTFDGVIAFDRIPGADVAYIANQCFRASNRGWRAALLALVPRYRRYTRLERDLFASSARTQILLLSSLQRDEYQAFYATPAARLHLIPPAISLDRVRPADAEQQRAQMRAELNLRDEDFCVLLVAANFATKGADRAIRAIASLPPSLRARVRFLALGSNDTASYGRLAEAAGAGDRVAFVPPRENILPYLLAADLLLHPSRRDTTGTVILEAIVAGLPVLCTGLCGYAEHVSKADAGVVLSEPFSQSALNGALAKALNRDSLQRWTRNAAEYGRSNDLFRGRQVAAELIERLIADRGKFAGHAPS